jgi:hypothetical protein
MGTVLTALSQLEEVSSMVGVGEGAVVGVAVGTSTSVGVGGTAVAVGVPVCTGMAVGGMVVAVDEGGMGVTAVSSSAVQALKTKRKVKKKKNNRELIVRTPDSI